MGLIEVVADRGHLDTLTGIAEQHKAIDYWIGGGEPDRRVSLRLLVDDSQQQAVLDALQTTLSGEESFRIILLPVEAVLPQREEPEAEGAAGRLAATREALYQEVVQGTRLNGSYLLLVLLSTVVVTIGLITGNVAVVIGSMVIAPLLGPHIALAFAAVLGDRHLGAVALRASAAGLALALLLSAAVGLLMPLAQLDPGILARTRVGLDSVALALASGAAAALSMTTGLPAVLVGVMVAVALLPPAAVTGLMLGSGRWHLALGGGLLLAVNVVCVNLAAQVVLLVQGLRPRTWLERKKAQQSARISLMFWLLALGVLVTVIVVMRYVMHAEF
ncbi:MAG TPA: TIGR00341 family protein [Gammaproteobacteria bacterium]|nr:TIGR00341 family protein [Gammaproteobacteria bacterium]